MRQWQTTNATILDDLSAHPSGDWCAVRYEDLIADPAGTLEQLSAFIGIPYGSGLRALTAKPLKPSAYTFTPPDREKWRRNEAAIRAVIGEVDALAARLENLPGAKKVSYAAQ
jgi:hypothetical protein